LLAGSEYAFDGEQADHPRLADDASVRRDLPDADVVHPRRRWTVEGRFVFE
jgi:hypothetical protein